MAVIFERPANQEDARAAYGMEKALTQSGYEKDEVTVRYTGEEGERFVAEVDG